MMSLPELLLQSYNRPITHWLTETYSGRREEPFDLDAPYQRGSVWTDDQRRALIKSLLIGLPVGAVITSFQGYTVAQSYRVIDGKQRVEAVRAFAENNLGTPADWWQEDDLLPGFTGETVFWNDLVERGRRRFDNRMLPELHADLTTEHKRVNGKWVTRKRSGDELLKAEAELYLLVNMAGTPQGDDDLARAAGLA